MSGRQKDQIDLSRLIAQLGINQAWEETKAKVVA